LTIDRGIRRGGAPAASQAGGSVLVQAPAGSGKTTLLVQRYLRLLAMVDAPERILALTFTRRARRRCANRVLLALGAARLERCPLGPESRDLEIGRGRVAGTSAHR